MSVCKKLINLLIPLVVGVLLVVPVCIIDNPLSLNQSLVGNALKGIFQFLLTDAQLQEAGIDA